MVTMSRQGIRRRGPGVNTVRELYGQFRHLIHEGGKFLVVGGIGAIVTIAGANILQSAHMDKYVAITIATVIATIVTFVGNRYWTFSHREGQGTARDTVMFFILNGVGLIIYYACIWLIQDVAGLKGKLWYNVALIVGTGLGTLFRFWSYRKWVWTAPATPAASLAGGPGADGPGPDGPGPEQERLSPAAPAAGRSGGAHRRS
jgi:putative flippase GtrA